MSGRRRGNFGSNNDSTQENTGGSSGNGNSKNTRNRGNRGHSGNSSGGGGRGSSSGRRGGGGRGRGRGRGSYSGRGDNSDDDVRSDGGGSGGGRRGGGGRGRGRGRGRGSNSGRGDNRDDDVRSDGGHDIIDQSHNHAPTPPRLSVPEIRQSQEETTITNFSSSELSYNGSDRLVFITNGEQIKTIWKRILRKDKPWNQSDARIFVSSVLVATDYQSGYEVEEVVTELGNPEGGLKRLREIINFPMMSCDAGFDDDVLSFQYVILPLLGLFTRTAITDCILERYVHAIFMVVYVNLVSI
jgi:hypothetical protein